MSSNASNAYPVQHSQHLSNPAPLGPSPPAHLPRLWLFVDLLYCSLLICNATISRSPVRVTWRNSSFPPSRCLSQWYVN
ncbi:hypothetical protein BYT27DRAFT_6676122 [Phlegmacium glaucopus]|nr:hypothetical protein BYT27DRAFT_6676122 [Phlegmacium glaucopus]